LPTAARLSTGLTDLFGQMPVLMVSAAVVLALSLLATYLSRKQARHLAAPRSLVLGLGVQVLLLTMLVLDHPKPIFMLSVAAVLPVLALAALDLLELRPALQRMLSRLLGAVILLGVVVSLGRSLAIVRAKATDVSKIEQQTRASILKHASSLGRKPEDLLVLWAYRSYSPCFALWYGNDSTGRAFKKEIADICPKDLEFNIWGQEAIGRAARPLDDVRWDMIISCESAFRTAELEALPGKEVFPSLQLGCGSLTIAHSQE
jgi:hypothetical protein